MLINLWSPTKGDVNLIAASGYNLAAVTDPGVSNDNTQGYGTGSIWFNSLAGALRWWECVSAATGAAQWVFSGAAYAAGGSSPNSEVTQFGSGASFASAEGNTYRVVQAATSPAVIGSGTSDIVMAVYSLPANSFDIANRGINILAQGSYGATGNNKRLKIIFNATTAVVGSAVTGGTTVCDTGTVATNTGGWSMEANVFKYGAAGSNTQVGLHQSAQSGGVVSTLLPPTLITAAENAAILVAITGDATTATSDILFNFFEINAMN